MRAHPVSRARRSQARPAKLSAPRLARAVARSGLFARLDALSDRPLTWIAGPPGSGKTTLAATWLAARQRRGAWIVVDEDDVEPATCFHWIGRALALLAPNQRARWPSLGADEQHDVVGHARRLFRLLAERLPPPWTVVLDNAQELPADSPVHAALAAAAAELPPGATVVVISREPPPPAYARLAATQQLGSIDGTALRLRPDETRELLASHGIGEGDETAQRLHDAADGWAAGLVLIAASEHGAGSLAFPEDAAASERVFDYFAAEVFGRMPAAEQDVAMRLAVLPVASAAMAQALCGTSLAGRVLADLHRRGLFVDRRGGADPVYAFHPLFRAFLDAQGCRAFAAGALGAVRLRAAALLEADGQLDAAAGLLLREGAWAALQRLAGEHAARLMAQGRSTALRAWLAALPDDLRAQPSSAYWLAQTEAATDPAAAERRFDAAHRGFEARGDALGRLLAAAGAAECIVLQGAGFARLDRWITVFETLEPTWRALDDPDTELRALPGMLAAFVARQAQHRLSGVLAERAERLLEREPAATQRILFGTMANACIDTGQHERVGRLVHRIGRLRDAAHVSPVTRLRWQHVEIVYKTLVGRLDEAVVDAREAVRMASDPAMARLRATTHVAAAHAYWVAGDAPAARGHLDAARPLVDPARLHDRSVLEFLSGVLAVQQGSPAVGATRLRSALDLAARAGSPGRERVAAFQLCLAETEAGDHEAAEEALRMATAHPSHEASPFHGWVIAVIEANLADRRGDRPRCLAALQRGLRIAQEHDYRYAPGLFATGIMPRMCAIALDHGIDAGFVRGLIAQHGLAPPDDAGPAWPWRVRVTTLGGFSIERDTTFAPPGRKESRRPLELLRLVIAGGGTAVNARKLAQALWPDADGAAAQNSFDNTLHRLRKLLGADDSVRLVDGGLTLDRAQVWVDADALDRALDAAERVIGAAKGIDAKGIDAPGALDALVEIDALADRAIGLYRGAFLDGDETFAELIAARERLHARFVRVTGAIAARHEVAGRWARAIELYERVLERDPLAEEVTRRAMLCCLQSDRRADAYALYRRFRDRLSLVLGVRPTRTTEALAERIRAP